MDARSSALSAKQQKALLSLARLTNQELEEVLNEYFRIYGEAVLPLVR